MGLSRRTSHKNSSWLFFPLIIYVVTLVLVCVGFLRVELKMYRHDQRINALAKVAEGNGPPSNNPNLPQSTKNAAGEFVHEKVLNFS